MKRIALVTIVVRDYDEAIAFYVDNLGFELLEDTHLERGKRWVVVAPEDDASPGFLLARASGERQLARVGDQTGGRVAFFVRTDDVARDHARMVANGVRFVRQPRREPYGTVAVFEDLYGNRFDLIEGTSS